MSLFDEHYEVVSKPAPATAGESAFVHIEHYFPKGYDPDKEPWKSIRQHHNAALAAERTKTDNLCKWYQQQLDAAAEALDSSRKHVVELSPSDFKLEWLDEIDAALAKVKIAGDTPAATGVPEIGNVESSHGDSG
jgi:hypothetical protein